MDIKELNKTQLILLTLLITFIVSIATGIVTVSLMQQAPKSVPQTINNVIQRTIEKVTTVPEQTTKPTSTPAGDTKDQATTFGDGDAMISIYPADEPPAPVGSTVTTLPPTPSATPAPLEPKALGQGIIISDVGLVLVDSSILSDKNVYKVILNKVDFDATILKKFNNGFAILKISQKTPVKAESTPAPNIDNKQ
jgi:hypothetical protein